MPLTLSQARRIALRAQQLDRPPAREPAAATVARTAERLGVIQIDSVNVLARAHYMPLYSRLGPYDVSQLDGLFSTPPRRIVEQWGHEACLVTPEVHRLLAPLRMRWVERRVGQTEQSHPGVLEAVHRVVEEHGPLTGREIQQHLAEEFPAPERPAGERGWWSWSAVKSAVELAFHGGTIASAGRNASFERRYDLTDRLFEPRTPATVDEAYEGLTAISLTKLGLGTARDIADYYRLRTAPVEGVLARLEARGEAERVDVGGVRGPVWKSPAASIPRRAEAVTLLSPFDPLIFFRPRAESLFGLHYRIGIYTPAEKRTRGYYSLPLLIGENIVGRYDLKADRKNAELLVNGAFAEPAFADRWPSEPEIASIAAGEFARVAGWRGLGRVVVPDDAVGDAAQATRRAVSSLSDFS